MSKDQKTNECIIFYRDGDYVIGVDKANNRRVSAKCHPEDTFDFYTGAKLCFDRLIKADKTEQVDKKVPFNADMAILCRTKEEYFRLIDFLFKIGYSFFDEDTELILKILFGFSIQLKTPKTPIRVFLNKKFHTINCASEKEKNFGNRILIDFKDVKFFNVRPKKMG